MLRMSVMLSIVILPLALLSAQDQEANRNNNDAIAKLRMLAGPGEPHGQLKKLSGSWSVAMRARNTDTGFAGTAEASMILGDRFLVIDGRGEAGGQQSEFRYTIGFDRRHDEYVITAMDTTGTYPVYARGKNAEAGIRMFGEDDDPQMKRLGFVKKFAFDLEMKSDDEFKLATQWVDTRTKEEPLIPAFEYVFTRKKAE